MTQYERIAQAYHQRIDAIAETVDAMAPGLQAAAAQIVDAALDDRRILVCATGLDASIAAYATMLLRGGAGGIPPLPALSLAGADDDARQSSLWRDLRTLSRDGDVLLCIDSAEGALTANEALQLARARNLCALLLSDLAEAEDAAAIMPLQGANAAVRRELAMMALHCLRDLIAELLMGE